MMKKAPAATFSSRHEVRTLEELFTELRAGLLRSPPFVRQFRWGPAEMMALLESVTGGYPIGAVVVWDPDDRQKVQPHFGPIAQAELPTDGGPATYVLDGYQRLATLFGVTHIDGLPPAEGNERCWWVWYDLEQEALVGAGDAEPQPQHLPMAHLLGTTNFLQFASRLQSARPTDAPKLIVRAERLAKTVRGFRLPVTRIRGGSLEDATEIAARLNRRP